MKIRSIISVIVGLAIGAQCFGQSKQLPIYSVGAAVSHDLMLIRNLQGGVYAASMLQSNGLVPSWSVNYNPEGVPTKEAIATIARAKALTFKLANASNDAVTLYMFCLSADWDVLFYGGNSFMLEHQSNGTWKMPAGAGNVTSYLNSVPIYEPEAMNATIILRDSAGNPMAFVAVDVQFNNATRMGKIMFPPSYIGQHGELIVYYAQRDTAGNIIGTYSAAFDMDTDGSLITPVSASATIEAGFGQLTVLNAPNVDLANIQSYNHLGVSPLVQITVASNQWVFVSASTTEGEKPKGFTLKKLVKNQDNIPVEYIIPAGAQYYPLQLEPGIYQIDFEWNFLQPAPVYPWWFDGGGKG